MNENDLKLLRLALNLHTRTVVGLIDAALRADTPAERTERLALARDAVLEFKTEMTEAWLSVTQT